MDKRTEATYNAWLNDRGDRMSTTATHLITLMMLLERKPRQKAADLADELGVSVRTIHRYMNELDEMGIPIYSERCPYGGFSPVRGHKMPPLVFTPHEAAAVYLRTSLVDEIWGDLYADAARGVTAKLDNVLPDEQRQEVAWAQRTLVAMEMRSRLPWNRKTGAARRPKIAAEGRWLPSSPSCGGWRSGMDLGDYEVRSWFGRTKIWG